MKILIKNYKLKKQKSHKKNNFEAGELLYQNSQNVMVNHNSNNAKFVNLHHNGNR